MNMKMKQEFLMCFQIKTLVDQTDSDFLAGSRYAAGLFVDPMFLGKLNLEDTNLFTKVDVPSEYARANFKVKENVIASYVMIDEKLSDKLSLLAGLRLENTNIEATGNQIEGEENILGTITKKSNYTNVLPGVHFKYNASNNTILRFAWTNTLARPNYADLVPSVDVVTDDEEVFLGNPGLNATTSMGFDLMAEHYFKNIGIISGGVFQKNIKDFVYTFQTEVTNDAFGTGTTGYDSFQPQNGDDASIFGAEISIQRKLDFPSRYC